ELTGYPPEAFVEGRVSYASLIAPEDRGRVWREVQAAVADGRPYELEYRILPPGGAERWVCEQGRAVEDGEEDGAPAALEGFITDATERVHARDALTGSERYYRALVENASEWVTVFDGEGRLLDLSAGVQRLTGHPSSSRAGGTIFDLMLPADVPRAREWVRALDRTPRGSAVLRVRFRRADGEVRMLEATGRNLLHVPEVRALVASLNDVSERAVAEERLEESEQRHRSLFQFNPDPVFSFDMAGRFTSFNAAVTELTGYAGDDLLGQPFAGLIVPEDREASERHFLLAAAGEPQHYSAGIRTHDGRRLELTVTKLPIWVNGSIAGVYGIAKDVTEQREAERQLRLRDRAIAAVTDGIVISDPHLPGNPIVHANPGFERLTGYSAEEIVGRNCRILQGEGTDPAAVARMAEAVRAGLPCEVEVLNYRKDGTPFWNVVSISPVREPGGRLSHFIGVLKDATQRREAERAVSDREQSFRSLIENAQDIIAVLEGDGYVRFASPSAERVLGYTVQEFVGVYLFELVHEDDVPRVLGVFDRAIRSPGEPQWSEFRMTRKDGGVRVLETVATSLLHDPAVMGIVVNSRDVTERREAEAALEVSRQQFLQSQKMEAIGRLAGGVAHDFNNLLTAIRGNADLLLLDLAEDDRAREDVEEIRRAADRAAALTRQLLAFSRRQVLTPKVISLNEVVTEMEKLLRRLIGDQVELVTELEADLGTARADPGQIEQVLLNLAVNGRDAMPEGGRLTVRTANSRLDDELARRFTYVVPGQYVLLEVRDEGTGMDRETMEQAFDPFFTTKESGRGTGLGLSTVYGIVKQSGGYIWIDSAPGEGTAVSIYLPRAGDEPAEEAADEAEAAEPALPRGSETVLVVQDESTVRHLSCRVLARTGYTVLEARDGYEGLRMAERHAGPIHLLLADLLMPRLGGRDLAVRLGQTHPEARVLFLSGSADAAARTGSADQVLEKPFTPEALAHRIRDVLDPPALPAAS
ncbi:MAG TPA: PAS domain S-box protein, partial [Longimicrobiaceae bacterium]|nr:PAS domain S-box protein [Longimicrobiaceae bacterium]